MSRGKPPINCDGPGCGKQKDKANHWWSVATSGDRIVILPTPDLPPGEFILVRDFCGASCALKYLSERMTKSDPQEGEQNAK